jgi:hypothetical protein
MTSLHRFSVNGGQVKGNSDEMLDKFHKYLLASHMNLYHPFAGRKEFSHACHIFESRFSPCF